MDHQVALAEGGGFGNELLRAPALARRPGEPVAENILLAEDQGTVELEAPFDIERCHQDRAARLWLDLAPILDIGCSHAMLPEQCTEDRKSTRLNSSH